MARFINPFTGTECQVADERKDEYLGAGFKLVPELSEQKPVEVTAPEEKEDKPEPKKAKVETAKKKTATTKKK